MDSSQMHATLGLHVNKLDVKTISAIHHPPTQCVLAHGSCL